MWVAAHSRRAPKAQTVAGAHLPAPLGGINSVSALSSMPPEDCVLGWNVMPGEDGLRVRLGYQEHVGPSAGAPTTAVITGASDNKVRTAIPYLGSIPAKHRLFAVTSTGIWDASTSGSTPTLKVTFGTQTGRAGFGVSHAIVTAGGHFLLYADEVNGLYVYTESTDAWAAIAMGGGATQISGVDPANIRFVGSFKQRVWLVEKDSQKAWYLATGSVYGAATQFKFDTAAGISGQARHGGHLVGLWNYTYDGGAGMDDSLVAITSGGDILIYQGTDPSSADSFALKGVWFCGGVVAGRRIANESGGDLLIASRLGLLPLSKLTSGGKGDDDRIYTTFKVTNLFTKLVAQYGDLDGWAIHDHPDENALVICHPTSSSGPTEQLLMSYATGGWYRFRDLPIISACAWAGGFYFGTDDGRMCRTAGHVDNITIADPNTYETIDWLVLGAYANGGNAAFKKVTRIDVLLMCESPTPLLAAYARYDFNKTEPPAPAGSVSAGAGTWNGSTWDADLWGGEAAPVRKQFGAAGEGRFVAIAVRGSSFCLTTLVGFDVTYEQGGLR
jgi:hypothetical protein